MYQNIFQNTATSLSTEQVKHAQAVFMNKVYGWMSIALVVTGLSALWVANTPEILNVVVGNRIVFYALIFAELGMVWWLSARAQKMSASAATMGFMAYSLLNGLTLSVIFLVYTSQALTSTFLITAGTFGAMSAFGYITKRDLTSLGSMLYMALIGLIIAMVVNIFIQSSMMGFVISAIGVLIFTGLTAYDTQKIKQSALIYQDNNEVHTKGAIQGALSLYLDFINLFLMLLRFFGGSRN